MVAMMTTTTGTNICQKERKKNVKPVTLWPIYVNDFHTCWQKNIDVLLTWRLFAIVLLNNAIVSQGSLDTAYLNDTFKVVRFFVYNQVQCKTAIQGRLP